MVSKVKLFAICKKIPTIPITFIVYGFFMMIHLRTVFWTCVVWIFTLLLAYGYTRVIDASLVSSIYADRLVVPEEQQQ